MTNAQQALQNVKDKAINAGRTFSIQELVERSAAELGKALPAHMRPERIVRIALTTLRLNQKLYQCDPQSFLGALFQCAQLGLEPNIEGQAYIIPYNVSVKTPSGWEKKLVAQFQIGYKGYVELYYRHQNAISLQMQPVHENDVFNLDLANNKCEHIPPKMGQDRGGVIGYYAIAHLSNGGKVLQTMTRAEVEQFAQRFSKCYDKEKSGFMDGTPWREHFDAMAMKTVMKKLMKLLPKSIEMQHALAMDETVKTRLSHDMLEVADETPRELQETAEEPQAQSPAGKKTVLDIKIHEAKAELMKLSPSPKRGEMGDGEKFYYNQLGLLGAEHMTELKQNEKEVFLGALQNKLGELKQAK